MSKWKGLAGLASLALAGTCDVATAQSTALPEIVITAPSPIAPPPGLGSIPYAPVTVMSAPEIRRAPATDLGDLLFATPGVTASSFAPGAASRPVIRGLDNTRIRIQENGLSVMDVSDLGEDHAVPIDPLTADKIEVIRGPATLRWGSQAIGGVVSVDNTRIPSVLPRLGFSGETRLGFDSATRGFEGAQIFRGRVDNTVVTADAFYRQTDDYRTPLGIQLNSAIETRGASLGITQFFDNGYVGVSLQHLRALYHIPGAGNEIDRSRIDLEQTKLTARGEVRPESELIEAIRFWAGASIYRHHEMGGEDILSTFRNREQEARVEWQLRPFATAFGPLTSAFGVQLGHQQLGTNGEAIGLLAPTRTFSLAAYLFNEVQLTDTLRLQAAGRIETNHVRGTATLFPDTLLPPPDVPDEIGRSRHFTPASASLGLVQALPYGLVARLTGQYAERAPKAAELFSRGPHEATETFEIGNPDLRKERATSIEIGISRPVGDLRFDLTAYYTRYSGFIYKHLTGIQCGEDFASCGVETELDQVLYSQRNARFYGVEATAQYDIAPLAGGILGVDAQYDFVNARFANGENVPRIPPHRLGGGLYWKDEAWFARISLLHAFDQNRIAPFETPTEGYNLLKAELSYTLKRPARLPFEDITLGIVGNNLLNEEIRNHVSFRKDEVLLPGRSVKIFANARF